MAKLKRVKRKRWYITQTLIILAMGFLLVCLIFLGPQRQGNLSGDFNFFEVLKMDFILSSAQINVPEKVFNIFPLKQMKQVAGEQELVVFAIAVVLMAISLLGGIMGACARYEGRSLKIGRATALINSGKKALGMIEISKPFVKNGMAHIIAVEENGKSLTLKGKIEYFHEFDDNSVPEGHYYAELVGDFKVHVYKNENTPDIFPMKA